tara:strand:- start:736 stop:1527 length:792 start_codon:yes stop_codon:yes gene_type:complete
MQSLVTIIILLSLIGIYINLGTSTDLSRPEFNEVADQGASIGDIGSEVTNVINENNEEVKTFDEIGNSLKTGNGLKEGSELINFNLNSLAVPNTRPDKWTNSSKNEIGNYGLVNNYLSHQNNYPYNERELSKINSREFIDSRVNVAPNRGGKSHALLSQIISPKEDSQYQNGYKFINRAIAIIKNQYANHNKILTDVRTVNAQEIANRASRTIRGITPKSIEIKSVPDILTAQSAKDHSNAHAVLRDMSNHPVNEMMNNFNFK